MSILFTDQRIFYSILFYWSFLVYYSKCSTVESQIQNSYSEWEKLYMDWLTSEQKVKLNEMIKQGATVDDLHLAAIKMYESTSGETLVEANKALLQASLAFIRYLTEQSAYYVNEFDRITGTASDPYTAAEQRVFVERTRQKLTHVADLLIEHIDDAEKLQLARKYLPSCVKVFLSSSRMIRNMIAEYEEHSYLIKDSDIAKWTNRYLSWLDDKEKAQLKALHDEGASFDELRETLEEFYAAAEGRRLVRANRLLREGCTALAEHLLGKEKTAKYIAIVKVLASFEETFHNQRDDLLSSIDLGFKRDVALNFLDSCDAVFHASSRSDRQNGLEHDEF